MLLFSLYALVFGLLIGSFINVVIYRLPLGEDIVYLRSHCTSCNKKIFWYENIPILSYLFLKGKCSGCQGKISLRYPFIELLIGLASYFFFPEVLTFENLTFYFFHFTTFCVFVALFFIDLDHRILPNSLNLYLAALFLFYALFFLPWKHWVFGSLLGFGLTATVTWVFYLLRGKVGLGGGDIKLFAVLGIYLGPHGIIRNIFLSCFLGSLIGSLLILSKKMKRDEPLPFGPFIIVVAVLQIYFDKYLNQFMNFLF